MDRQVKDPRGLDPANWLENYGDLLFDFTLKRVMVREQAEDIVQEVFSSAWKNRESFDHSVQEKTWLFVICQRKIIDHYRKNQFRKHSALSTQEAEDDFFLEDGHFNNTYKPGHDWMIPQDTILQKDFHQVLRGCIARLKELQEKVFSLKYLNHLEAAEICALLEITDKNYWVLMHRAKIQLRACLEKNWIK